MFPVALAKGALRAPRFLPGPLRQGPGEAPPAHAQRRARGGRAGGKEPGRAGPVRQRRPRRPWCRRCRKRSGTGHVSSHSAEIRHVGRAKAQCRYVSGVRGLIFRAGSVAGRERWGWEEGRRDGAAGGNGLRAGLLERDAPRPDFPVWPRPDGSSGNGGGTTLHAPAELTGQPDAARVCPPPGWAAGAGGAQSPLRRQQPVERTLERADCPITSGL